MAGVKRQAFERLMHWRRWAKRAGLDRVARRYPHLQSVFRTVYRSLFRILEPPGMLTADINGLRISVGAKNRDLALLLAEGTWEPQQTKLIESLLSEGMVFVDVGAHIGLYTLHAARRVGPGGRVYAFEPAPDNFRMLEQNIAQNRMSRVVAEPLAVWSGPGRAEFTLSENDSASHSLGSSSRQSLRVKVRTTSLDEYFVQKDVRIDVIKIDAEGAECRIIEGMQQILRNNPQVILFTEFYPRAIEAFGDSPVNFLEQLHGLGFSLAPFEESRPKRERVEPSEFAELTASLRANGTAVNLLCRPESNRVSVTVPRKAATEAQQSGPSDRPIAPLISVAIPTYNRGALLERALDSMLPQLAEDMEIVVYDTGSIDDTRKRVERLAVDFPTLRFFAIPVRQSLDEALLRLLGISRGEYVWFFSSDDQMKKGALQAVRQRILRAGERPALVYVNQEIVDEAGRLLIGSQAGSAHDRDFADGRAIVPWLALNLGFISASLIRRETALAIPSAVEFIGTRSLNLHLYLCCLREGGPALYIGKPLIQARRVAGPPPYEYRDVFVRDVVRIFEDARRRGYSRFTIYRTMQRIVAGEYLRLVLSWRSDNPAELARTFPEMFGACWMYPAFWLLVVPTRLTPPWLARTVRNRLRQRRERRNRRRQLLDMGCDDAGSRHTVSQAIRFRGWFRALVLARNLIAASGADRLWKSVPYLVSAYRALYAWSRPKETIRAVVGDQVMYLDLTDLVLTRSLVTMGVWEPFETHLFAKTLQAGMVVVDVGANIGHYALEAARRVGEKGKVFAFEPEPHNFDLLCRNIEANSYQNVTPVQKALSDHCGSARLALSPDNFGGHHLDNSAVTGGCVEVETITLDEHFGGRPEKIGVIKMDAEGAEMSIFEGMKGLLDANPDLILFTEFSPVAIQAAGHDPEKFLKTLLASGFQIGIVDQEKTRIEALATSHLGTFVNSLLREENGKFYVDLLCLRGKAIRGPFGPHEWWHGPAYARASFAGQD